MGELRALQTLGLVLALVLALPAFAEAARPEPDSSANQTESSIFENENTLGSGLISFDAVIGDDGWLNYRLRPGIFFGEFAEDLTARVGLEFGYGDGPGKLERSSFELEAWIGKEFSIAGLLPGFIGLGANVGYVEAEDDHNTLGSDEGLRFQIQPTLNLAVLQVRTGWQFDDLESDINEYWAGLSLIWPEAVPFRLTIGWRRLALKRDTHSGLWLGLDVDLWLLFNPMDG